MREADTLQIVRHAVMQQWNEERVALRQRTLLVPERACVIIEIDLVLVKLHNELGLAQILHCANEFAVDLAASGRVSTISAHGIRTPRANPREHAPVDLA